MRAYDVISKKRDKQALNKDEIEFFIKEYTAGNIPDYQASALLMACFLNGLDEIETYNLTMAMKNSGKSIDLGVLGEKSVDKHSTGGVGDKTTLIVAPIVASLGVPVAQMSGRGLGHTGGTLDKLEAIEGFSAYKTDEEFIELLKSVKGAIIGQTEELAPADKKLYALRDVTATVECIPLIVASIMSKKLATGADGIVLDVKTGSGAFMQKESDAKELARQLISVGKRAGKRMIAVLTDMDVPLGRYIGNALEVEEAVLTLKGGGSADLRELCLVLSAYMLVAADKGSYEECYSLAKKALDDGKAFDSFLKMIEAQGGNTEVILNTSLLPKAKYTKPYLAKSQGYIVGINAKTVGVASLCLGAGRSRKEDPVDYAAGIVLTKKTGDYAARGEEVAVLYANDEGKFEESGKMLDEAFFYGENPPKSRPLILEVIQ